MSTMITMEKQGNTLHLSGSLDNNNLAVVWSKYSQFVDVNDIEVGKLTRVDSAGLALLVYLCLEYRARLIEVLPQLQTLLELYDLEPVVLSN